MKWLMLTCSPGPSRPAFPGSADLRRVSSDVVLHQAELVALRIAHHDHHALVVVMAFSGLAPAEPQHGPDALVDVTDGHIEMDPGLAELGLGHRLEVDPRRRIPAAPQLTPARQRGRLLPAQQGAPEGGQPAWVKAVDRDPRDYARHGRILAHRDVLSLVRVREKGVWR